MDSPQSAKRNTLILAQRDLQWISNLEYYKIIILCCFKLLVLYNQLQQQQRMNTSIQVMSPPPGQLLFAVEMGQIQITCISLEPGRCRILLLTAQQKAQGIGQIGGEMNPRKNKKISTHFTTFTLSLNLLPYFATTYTMCFVFFKYSFYFSSLPTNVWSALISSSFNLIIKK